MNPDAPVPAARLFGGSSDAADSPSLQNSFAPLPLPAIPDHELIRLIGRGSYGQVWLARNAVGTLRAIKVVYRKTFNTDRPYEREFSGIKKFEPISRSHESLIDVLHVGRNDGAGYFYYVMELADPVENPNEKFRTPKEARIPNAETDRGNDKIRTSGF